MYAYVEGHSAAFDLLILLPYTVPLIHYAAWAAQTRVALWPCLHDEPYAYLEPVRLLMESAWGVFFNTPEERALAVQRLGMRLSRDAVLGGGVDPLAVTSGTVDPNAILYVGRLEEGKNVPLLYRYVGRGNPK